MKNITRISLILITAIFTSMSVWADGFISVGEGSVNGDLEVPIVLQCEKALSCLSLTINYKNVAIDAGGIKLNEARFPWKNRAVTISINEDRQEVVFSVADLVGQNAMVTKGAGTLLHIPVSGLADGVSDTMLTIKRVQAFDQYGDALELAIL